jgi:hypothetical protein
MIKSTAIAYAILSNHTSIGKPEYRFLKSLEPHVYTQFEESRHQILILHTQGYNQREICEQMEKNPEKYQAFVSRTLKDFRLRGVI